MDKEIKTGGVSIEVNGRKIDNPILRVLICALALIFVVLIAALVFIFVLPLVGLAIGLPMVITGVALVGLGLGIPIFITGGAFLTLLLSPLKFIKKFNINRKK